MLFGPKMLPDDEVIAVIKSAMSTLSMETEVLGFPALCFDSRLVPTFAMLSLTTEMDFWAAYAPERDSVRDMMGSNTDVRPSQSLCHPSEAFVVLSGSWH
jgi:hypothetical protein